MNGLLTAAVMFCWASTKLPAPAANRIVPLVSHISGDLSTDLVIISGTDY